MVNQLGGGELECHGGHGGRGQSDNSFWRRQVVASFLTLA